MPTSCPGVPIPVGSTNDLKPASLTWVRRKVVLPWKERGNDQRRRENSRQAAKSEIITDANDQEMVPHCRP
jgi:hypothetical protein